MYGHRSHPESFLLPLPVQKPFRRPETFVLPLPVQQPFHLLSSFVHPVLPLVLGSPARPLVLTSLVQPALPLLLRPILPLEASLPNLQFHLLRKKKKRLTNPLSSITAGSCGGKKVLS